MHAGAVGRSLTGFSLVLSFSLPAMGGAATVTVVASHGVGDGSSAVEAPIGDPVDVAVGPDGTLYVVDALNLRLRVVSPDGVISTVAGTGVARYHGDGGAARTATFSAPVAVAADSAGSLYVVDKWAHRVRKISPAGTIETVAGDGEQGFDGDGGPATAARLNAPGGIAVDGSGQLYIADTGNNRIRKVAADGTIATIAGSGALGAEGDGGLATAAELSAPTLIAVDGAGRVCFYDSGNRYVRRIDEQGSIIGAQVVGGVEGLEADTDGAVYVSHQGRVWRRDLGGDVRVIAGSGSTGFRGDGGPAVEAVFWGAGAIAVGPDGTVFVADIGNRVVRRIDAGGTIVTVAGNRTMGSFGEGGPADGAGFSCADVVPGLAGELYVSDPLNHRVAIIRSDGRIETYAGNGSTAYYGDGGPARTAALFAPAGLAVDGDGNLFVADLGNNRIRKVRPDGTIETVAGSGEQGFSGDGGPALAAQLDGPGAVAIGPDDALYISDARNRRIRRVDKQGTITTVAGDSSDGTPPDGVAAIGVPLGVPGGLAVRPDGTLVVAIPGQEAIREIDPFGRVWTRGDAASPVFDVALDADNTVVAATPNAIMRFASGSAPTVTAGDGQDAEMLGAPVSVAAGPAGELYVCDAAGRRILHLSAL